MSCILSVLYLVPMPCTLSNHCHWPVCCPPSLGVSFSQGHDCRRPLPISTPAPPVAETTPWSDGNEWSKKPWNPAPTSKPSPTTTTTTTAATTTTAVFVPTTTVPSGDGGLANGQFCTAENEFYADQNDCQKYFRYKESFSKADLVVHVSFEQPFLARTVLKPPPNEFSVLCPKNIGLALNRFCSCFKVRQQEDCSADLQWRPTLEPVWQYLPMAILCGLWKEEK